MKKTIIKRRKRVVPALRDQSPTGATHSSNGSSASPEASPATLAHYEDHRYMSNEPVDFRTHSTGRASPHDPHRPYSFAPPPVDFTNYSGGAFPSHHQPPRLLEPGQIGHDHPAQYGRRSASPNISNPKKRSLAETASSAEALAVPTTLELGSNQLPPIMSSANPSPPGRLSSISSLLNHAGPHEDPRLDPSLAALSRQQVQPDTRSFSHPQSNASDDGRGADRRSRLQREAEQMREALRAKERELAELGRL